MVYDFSFFRAAVSIFKLGVKDVGKQLFHTGVDLLNDISQGDNKTATKRWSKEAVKNLTGEVSVALKSMIGSGQRNKKRKRPQSSLSRPKSKKVKAPDIFA